MTAFCPDSPVFLPCIMGPTGAGKTATALSLADALPASVLNADSRQVYHDFKLITAQPSDEEQAVCPHLLYGFLPPEQKLGAGEYVRLASAGIETVLKNERLPLVVGGTGLYFRALLEGIAPIPTVPEEIDKDWRARLDKEGGPALHALLARRDPDYAAKIHPNDRQRIGRALAVLAATGRNFSWWHAQAVPRSPFAACKVGIGLPLANLEPVLAGRIDKMLEKGALEEARAAMIICADPNAPGWSGIGCAEIHRYLKGKLGLEECRSLWLKNTRAYAKRQLTWFRADRNIRWFAPHEAGKARDYILRALEGRGKIR